MRFILRLILKILFGFRTHGFDSLPEHGPLLLIPNHVSWMDWLLLGAVLPEHWRFVVSGVTAQTSWFHRKIMLNKRTFVLDPTAPHAARSVARYLREGGCLVLFVEGRISRTGSLMKIFNGIGFFITKTNARAVFCHLRGAERLQVALNPGWRLWFPRLSVHLSETFTAPSTAGRPARAARKHLANWVRERMTALRFETEMRWGADTVPEEIERTARMRPGFRVLEDPTHAAMSYARVLALANLQAAQLDTLAALRLPLTGILLPNGIPCAVLLLSLWALGKTPALLNPATGSAGLLAAICQARIRCVITSREFLQRTALAGETFTAKGAALVFLEDLPRPSPARILWETLRSRIRLRFSRSASAGNTAACVQKTDATAVILFTSGSEGTPKAVQLSHRNLLANIRQMHSVCDLHNADRIFNALPLFHSLGLTVGTLFGLARGCAVFLHPHPMHYHAVPDIIYDKNSTVVLSTNTFLTGYARRAHPYDFRSVRYLIAAGEAVQAETFRLWSERFGVRILEGYGATECGPALSANVPLACKVGSAGRFLPGIEWRLEPVEGVSEGGRLLVRGPNVMRGYLHGPGAGLGVARWYDTGDVARVDAEGFVFLLGRLKRFAKIGAEMISLCAMEAALDEFFQGQGMEQNSTALLRRAEPGEGERIVAVTCLRNVNRQMLRECLLDRGFSALGVPGEVRFLSRMPRLATGKIDLQHLQRLLDQNQLPPHGEFAACAAHPPL